MRPQDNSLEPGSFEWILFKLPYRGPDCPLGVWVIIYDLPDISDRKLDV